jgi:hypothetical protein
MKKIILIAAIVCNSSAFAETADNVATYFVNNFELQSNQSFSGIACGVSGCSVDMIENGMTVSNFMFTGEINQSNNSFKATITLQDKIANETTVSALVCLQNNECKYFETNQLNKADFAYENGEFDKERAKRNVLVQGWNLSAPIRSAISFEAQRGYNQYVRGPLTNTIDNWAKRYGQSQVNNAMYSRRP